MDYIKDYSPADVMANSNSDVYLHYFYFQAFGDEFDVRRSDFECVRSQGDRLIGQLSDRTEQKALATQMEDISQRLERIQNLMHEKERGVGAIRHNSVEEFNVALKVCTDRLQQLNTNLGEFENFESFREEHDRLQLQVGF